MIAPCLPLGHSATRSRSIVTEAIRSCRLTGLHSAVARKEGAWMRGAARPTEAATALTDGCGFNQSISGEVEVLLEPFSAFCRGDVEQIQPIRAML